MQFIDLKTQYTKIRAQIDEKIQRVFDHGTYIMGPEVVALEQKLADYINVKHCITVASGTDALLIAMMALGIQPGDEIITTPFTFIATAEMVRLLGAKIVFVDVDPDTYNIDPLLIQKAITKKTKVILPVNVYGQCADFDAINQIAKDHNIFVIEDAAQSFGATYKNRFSGSLSDIGCTSFFPAKPLGCYGDGGACFTNDEEFADKMRKIRNHGQSTRYNHVILGLNSRLDSLQAAILLAKFEIFHEEILLRNQVAQQYNNLLSGYVKTPFVEEHNQCVYAQYTILLEKRDEVQLYLQGAGIPTAIHYPIPLHKQPVFADLDVAKMAFPVAEHLSKRVLSLPFHPYLSDQDIKTIGESVISAVKQEVMEVCS